MSLDAILERVLEKREPRSFADVPAWWSAHAALGLSPIDAAIAGGAMADRFAWAFASGYVAAIHAMGFEGFACVAATEEDGAHPRAIKTKLEGDRVVGKKRFVTLGTHADTLLVVASVGEREGHPDLRVVRVPRGSVTMLSSFSAGFVPEIEHAEIEIDAAGEVVGGDGYERFLKPFRTVEDLHVHAALIAHLVALGRRFGFPRHVLSELTAGLCAARALSVCDPSSPRVHVALGGLIAQVSELFQTLDDGIFDRCPEDVRERVMRDRALFQVAGKARQARFDRAWESL